MKIKKVNIESGNEIMRKRGSVMSFFGVFVYEWNPHGPLTKSTLKRVFFMSAFAAQQHCTISFR